MSGCSSEMSSLHRCIILLARNQKPSYRCTTFDRSLSTTNNVAGFAVAPYTPFNKNGDVETSSFSSCVKYFKDAGFDGMFVNGTLGEGLSMSTKERKHVAEKWTEHSEGLFTLLHVGAGNLPDTKALAKHAEELGVDAIAALPTTYYKPSNEEQLVSYLAEVATCAPNTPFMYYEYDVTTGVRMNVPHLLAQAEHKIPTFYGVKHTTADLNSALNCSQVCNGKYKIFYGTETQYLPALSIGLPDVITSPYMGKYFQQIKSAFDTGDTAIAQRIQKEALALINIQTSHGGGITGSKAMFELLSNISVGVPRLPLPRMTSETMAKMRQDLKEAGFIKS